MGSTNAATQQEIADLRQLGGLPKYANQRLNAILDADDLGLRGNSLSLAVGAIAGEPTDEELDQQPTRSTALPTIAPAVGPLTLSGDDDTLGDGPSTRKRTSSAGTPERTARDDFLEAPTRPNTKSTTARAELAPSEGLAPPPENDQETLTTVLARGGTRVEVEAPTLTQRPTDDSDPDSVDLDATTAAREID